MSKYTLQKGPERTSYFAVYTLDMLQKLANQNQSLGHFTFTEKRSQRAVNFVIYFMKQSSCCLQLGRATAIAMQQQPRAVALQRYGDHETFDGLNAPIVSAVFVDGDEQPSQPLSQKQEAREVLPSNLSYKDQGREVGDVLLAPQLFIQNRHESHLPSQLSYKDQGRDLESILVSRQGHAVRHQEREEVLPAQRQQQRNVAHNPHQGHAILSLQPHGHSDFSRHKKTILWGIMAGVLLLAVVVAVVIVMITANTHTIDAFGNETSASPTEVPTASPTRETVGTEDAFDGNARLVLGLINATQTMSLAQLGWFLVTLSSLLEQDLVAIDRPFQPGWTMGLQDQRLIAPSAATSQLVVALSLTIPFDERADFIPTKSQVERLLESTVEKEQQRWLEQLVSADSPSAREYFSQLGGIQVYPPTTDLAAIPDVLPEEPSPTREPTTRKPIQVPATPLPTRPPRYLVFETPNELRQAIIAYAVNPEPGTIVAETYGHPIGSWYVHVF